MSDERAMSVAQKYPRLGRTCRKFLVGWSESARVLGRGG